MQSLSGNNNYIHIIIILTDSCVTGFFLPYSFFFFTLHLGPSMQSNSEDHQDFHILDEVLIDSI